MLNGHHHAGIAQLVEHLICNQGVAGSNPAAGTNEFKGLAVKLAAKPFLFGCNECNQPYLSKWL
jgi:hypothetical protein